MGKGELDLDELGGKLERLGSVKLGDSVLIFRPKDYELMIFRDGRAIIKGTQDEGIAKSLYSRYVGN
jgi:adenylyltransferase/sulfurtransferase